jgi:hypothetical protein
MSKVGHIWGVGNLFLFCFLNFLFFEDQMTVEGLEPFDGAQGKEWKSGRLDWTTDG